MANSISIIIATSGRVEKIHRLLESICRVGGRERIDHEIVIANNAADEPCGAAVESLVNEYNRASGIKCWQVREPAQVKGNLIAFLDDDVEVLPEWLEAIDGFFADQPHDVMQGSILMRPEDQKDEILQQALSQFRTVDFLDYKYPRGTDIKTLTGGKIVVRREVFEAVGRFDERLGPGGFGISEDVEFASRVVKAGKRIGWEGRAGVYNELDPSRLCDEEFRRRHTLQGISRLAYKRSSYFSIVPNLMRSVWTFGWYSLMGNVRRKYRAKGRYFHYRAMLLEKTKRTAGNQV
ncbi:MAG: Glycosyltransferase [Deltaproteobacteria bacterium]|nr:Glycosyltransferase [Deltaproteobacteria bacterium]